MTLQQLQDAQEEMGAQEQDRRYKECVGRGGCELATLGGSAGMLEFTGTLETTPVIFEYCTHCLKMPGNDAPSVS